MSDPESSTTATNDIPYDDLLNAIEYGWETIEDYARRVRALESLQSAFVRTNSLHVNGSYFEYRSPEIDQFMKATADKIVELLRNARTDAQDRK